MRKLFVIVSMVTIAVLLSGCTVCNISTGMATGTYTLDGKAYMQEEMSLNKDSVVNFTVSSADAPLSVYIMDEPNYDLYKANSTAWGALLDARADPRVSGTFIAPENRTYYFVVANDESRATSFTMDLKW